MGLNFSETMSWVCGAKRCLDDMLVAWENNSKSNFFVVPFERVGEIRSFKGLIGLLALVVGRLWPKRHNWLANQLIL